VTLFYSTGFKTDEGSYSFDLKAVNSVPGDFKKEQNKKAAKENFGFENIEQTDSRLKVKLTVTPLSKESNMMTVVGKGQLKIDKSVYNFEVDNSTSRLTKANLDNGMTFIYGPVDVRIKNKKGQNMEMTLGVNYLPELDKTLVNVTTGSIEGDVIFIPFGQLDVSTEVGESIKNYMEEVARAQNVN